MIKCYPIRNISTINVKMCQNILVGISLLIFQIINSYQYPIESQNKPFSDYKQCNFNFYKNGCQNETSSLCVNDTCVCQRAFIWDSKSRSCIVDKIYQDNTSTNQRNASLQSISSDKIEGKGGGTFIFENFWLSFHEFIQLEGRGSDGRGGGRASTKSSKKMAKTIKSAVHVSRDEETTDSSIDYFMIFDIFGLIIIVLLIIRYFLCSDQNNYEHFDN